MKSRKIISLILAVLLLLNTCVVLSSCSSVKEFEDEAESPVKGLVCVAIHHNFIKNYGYDQYIFYDPDTLVMYAMIADADGTSLSVLYNADGTLKLYNPSETK